MRLIKSSNLLSILLSLLMVSNIFAESCPKMANHEFSMVTFTSYGSIGQNQSISCEYQGTTRDINYNYTYNNDQQASMGSGNWFTGGGAMWYECFQPNRQGCQWNVSQPF